VRLFWVGVVAFNSGLSVGAFAFPDIGQTVVAKFFGVFQVFAVAYAVFRTLNWKFVALESCFDVLSAIGGCGYVVLERFVLSELLGYEWPGGDREFEVNF
jgi:hypothetical protein